MSSHERHHLHDESLDRAPSDTTGDNLRDGIRSYCLGLALASILTGASFWAAYTHLIYAPAVPVAIAVFAFAQMGIHLVFFLHITTGPDNTNNILALAFGVLTTLLIIFGSIWIMDNLQHNMGMQRMPPM